MATETPGTDNFHGNITLYDSTSHISKRVVFIKAQPPSERTKACIAFLFKIERINVSAFDKDSGEYVLDVLLSEPSSKLDTSCSFQVRKTYKQFKELRRLVHHWSDKHFVLPKYGIVACVYCKQFLSRAEEKRWPGSLARIVQSKETTEKQFEAFINDYISHARLPRPGELECQGFDHIPSIVTRFLSPELAALHGDTESEGIGSKDEVAEKKTGPLGDEHEEKVQ